MAFGNNDVNTDPQGNSPKSDPPESNALKEQSYQNDFIIVGIGASAGGLEAILAFFDHLPSDTGAGFVIITHLDPHHSSMMPELIQKHTSMNVLQVQDEVLVEPNQVYVIPPNKIMGIFGRRLQLLEREDDVLSRKPVDYFLRTLAHDQGDRAMCIILSGMDADGTQGLLEIKSELGVAIVQLPSSARFTVMPQSAIDTGLADFVLAPEEIAGKIIEYTRRLSTRIHFKVSVDSQIPDILRKIFILLRSMTGHDFSVYKKSTILRRIERRLVAVHLDNFDLYLRYLQDNPQEAELLFNDFLIGVTGFFRDPEVFDALKIIALPKLLHSKPDGYQIRVWVVGCSTGEEAYSIAMLLKEYMIENNRDFTVQIFATDIDDRALVTARTGVYDASSVGVIKPQLLSRYFVKEDTSYRIKRGIREMLVFASHSVIKDPPFTRIDLISCRNLLIYLDTEAQNKFLPLLHFSLKSGGFLFLGTSESVGKFTDLFLPIDKKCKIFEKIGVRSSLSPVYDFPSPQRSGRMEEKNIRKGTEVDMEKQVEKILLKQFNSDCIVIDEKGTIVYIYGHIGNYLEFSQGRPRSNVFEMTREGLKIPLIAAIRKAVSESNTVSVDGRIHEKEKEIGVRATVIPLTDTEGLNGLMLVLFETLRESCAAIKRQVDVGHDEYVDQLEKELQNTQESLQTTIEELQTTNEELTSTNEEYQSTNEELQSANEELETSKEELQSLNEELVTVNSELQNKLEELSKNIADNRNVLENLKIPTMILDREFRIRRFTVGVTKLINLIDSDIGRPIGHLVSNIKNENLTELFKTVLEQPRLIEKEIVTIDGNTYLMRILPYRSVNESIDGVVITFVDIQEAKSLRSKLLVSEAGRKLATNIIATIAEPFIALDSELKVVSANSSFYRTFRVVEEETIGKSIFELGKRQWDIPALRELLGQILPNQDTFNNFLVTFDFPKIGKHEFLLHARRVSGQQPDDELILLSFQNVPLNGTV
jgi:two-component system CheB/CheR fusion protein